MFTLPILYLWLAVISVPRVHAEQNVTCSDSWLFVDIHYRAVAGVNDAFSYGLFIGAGTSSQNQSLWPSLTTNETTLASTEYCVESSPANCDDPKFTHGQFSNAVSATWNTTPNYVSLDVSAATDLGNLSMGTDHLNVFTHYYDPSPATKFVLDNHPISVMSDYTSNRDVFFNSGSLGLGSSSTFLKQLRDVGRISRNVVGIYTGTAYPRAGGIQNGSIVLGGYDAGRMVGDVHKYSQSTPPAAGLSPLKVHVKQLSLVTKDGTSVALVTDDGFDGYISTAQYELEFPQAVTKGLTDALGGSVAEGSEDVLQLKQQFNGNLTMTLDDGYEITFPSEWISNASGLTPISTANLQSNVSTASSQFVLGAAFLHHIYLTIDYDDSSFYLADVKMLNNYVQPQSLCAGTMPIPIIAPTVSKFAQSGLIGAIIGGLLGGIAVVWVILFYVRKRLQYKQSRDKINQMEGGGADPSRRSILRNKTKAALSLRGKRTKSVVFTQDAKRVSHSDSDTSSMKGPTINVVAAIVDGPEAGIELSSIRKGLSDPSSKQGNSPPPPYNTGTSRKDTLPNPERFTDPYASSPLPTPMTANTPRTGNPLLGDFHQNYSEYDDNDDSDLYPSQCREHKRGHQRVASDHLRVKLGLRVNIDPKVNNKGSKRPKPAPAPVKVKYDPATTAKAATGNKKSPSFRMLRKVFPAA